MCSPSVDGSAASSTTAVLGEGSCSITAASPAAPPAAAMLNSWSSARVATCRRADSTGSGAESGIQDAPSRETADYSPLAPLLQAAAAAAAAERQQQQAPAATEQ